MSHSLNSRSLPRDRPQGSRTGACEIAASDVLTAPQRSFDQSSVWPAVLGPPRDHGLRGAGARTGRRRPFPRRLGLGILGSSPAATGAAIRARGLALGALVATVIFVAAPAFAQSAEPDPWEVAAQINGAMELMDYGTADSLLGSIEASHPGHAAGLFMRGKYLFHMGDYDEALVLLDGALELAPGAGAITSLRSLVAETRDVVAGYETYTTADGLFEIRYDASRDAVLIPWAEETLEAAYYEIGYDVGYWPEPPVRVEIYPEARTLARVSSLTEEAIEGSGTIALCKYNKLMFTSPRATLRGYGWRTTLSHEYVHYVVGHHVHADIPIWMHEALAKYLEERWTGTRNLRMTPHREELLSERIEANNLITFEQMHPSMAYLPTPEDASTAYAEVFTVMEYLVRRRGTSVIREMLGHIKDGSDVIAAIELTVGEDFDDFERNWTSYMRGRPRVEIPGDFEDEIQLMPESGADEGVDRLAGVDSVEAQDYLRLGELLRARDMIAAAVVEYQKAELLLGSANPILQNALARALLDLGRGDDALQAVTEVVEWHPSFYPSHLHRGEALSLLGRHEEARDSLVAAGGINPFDPAVHTLLSSVYQALGDAEMAARHHEFARLVQ